MVTYDLNKVVRKRHYCRPWRSITRLASELKVLAATMRRAVRRHLNVFPDNFQRRHELVDMQRKGRWEKYRLRLAWAANEEHLEIVLTDEKNLMVDGRHNTESSPVLVPASELADVTSWVVFGHTFAVSFMS